MPTPEQTIANRIAIYGSLERRDEVRAHIAAYLREFYAACRAGTCACEHRPGGRCVRYVPTEADRERARRAWAVAR